MKKMLEFKAPVAVAEFNKFMEENPTVTLGEPSVVSSATGYVHSILVVAEMSEETPETLK